IEREVAAAAARLGHQQTVPDAPADLSMIGLERVLRRLEAQESERPSQEHHRALVLAVDDADQAERDPAEKAPVGAGEVPPVGRVPQMLEVLERDRELR